MKEPRRRKMIVKLAVILFLTAMTASAQSPPQQGLPKVPEPVYISIAYSTSAGIGKISAADRDGRVQQWLEVWENELKSPNVITYVLVGDGVSFTATWGRGRIDPRVFGCMASEVPEFGEKTFWTATVIAGLVTFSEIKDDGIEGLFENVNRARTDLGAPEGLELARGGYATIVQKNLVNFMKVKNRKKWLDKGWLQPATKCVHHF